MAEIEITLPTVQYGNVKVRATPEELGLSDISDSHALGVAAAVYLNLFSQGFKVGAQMDVSASVTVSQPVTEEQAQRYLEEGLGATVVEENQYDRKHEVLSEGVSDKPYDNPPPPAKKPWEADGVTAPAVLDALGPGW